MIGRVRSIRDRHHLLGAKAALDQLASIVNVELGGRGIRAQHAREAPHRSRASG
jgi:hypothetical protein